MKILTVAVPAYNVEKYIDKCLNSFIDKTIMNELEVIIVNDGSTDKTANLVEKYCQQYPNTFFLINKKNGGHGSAINVAVKEAKGKYFRVVDADDWVDTAAHVRIFKSLKNSTVDVVISDYTNVNMLTSERFPINDIHLEPYKIYHLNKDELKADNLGLAQIIYRTYILQNNNITFTENTFYEDFEYTIFPFKYISTFQYINENIYNVLFANASQSTSKKNMVSRLDHLERIAKSLIVFLETSELDGYRLLYCKQKTVHLVYSFLLIALVYENNTKNGRFLADSLKKYVAIHYSPLWKLIRVRYRLYYLVNLLHLKSSGYEKTINLIRRK